MENSDRCFPSFLCEFGWNPANRWIWNSVIFLHHVINTQVFTPPLSAAPTSANVLPGLRLQVALEQWVEFICSLQSGEPGKRPSGSVHLLKMLDTLDLQSTSYALTAVYWFVVLFWSWTRGLTGCSPLLTQVSEGSRSDATHTSRNTQRLFIWSDWHLPLFTFLFSRPSSSRLNDSLLLTLSF